MYVQIPIKIRAIGVRKRSNASIILTGKPEINLPGIPP
jgi:hypothetical protein